MTRFDADDATGRRKLFADAVVAHRTRGSGFLTVEVDPDSAADGPDDSDGPDGPDDSDGPDDPEAEVPPPWIQFADKTFNLDCTDAELDRLKDLLDEFPEFRIDSIERPDEAEGANVRITARSDPNRLAGFMDSALQTTYDLDDDYRAWVTQI